MITTCPYCCHSVQIQEGSSLQKCGGCGSPFNPTVKPDKPFKGPEFMRRALQKQQVLEWLQREIKAKDEAA